MIKCKRCGSEDKVTEYTFELKNFTGDKPKITESKYCLCLQCEENLYSQEKKNEDTATT